MILDRGDFLTAPGWQGSGSGPRSLPAMSGVPDAVQGLDGALRPAVPTRQPGHPRNPASAEPVRASGGNGDGSETDAERESNEVPPAPPGSPVAEAVYEAALKAVRKFFAAADKLGDDAGPDALPIDSVEGVANDIVDTMEAAGDELVGRAVGPYTDARRFVIPHSVNVAVLSVRVGAELDLSDEELFLLCVAGLVHDVGTVRVPPEIFNKPDSLSGDEWEQMQERPVHSRDILATLGRQYAPVAEAAHQVHERLDGSGYPRGLSGEAVSLEASILGAVDIFEAFIHPRPYKKTVPAAAMYGVDSLMRLSHQFGDGVLKSLVRSIGLFPVGTYVKLNSGEVGRVTKGRQTNPMRPCVKVVYDTQSRSRTDGKRIDLMTTPHLYVFRPLSAQDLEELGLQ